MANAGNPSVAARAGAFLFRTRNALFPIAFAGILVAFPPHPDHWLLCGAGILVAVLGEALRILTLGLTHIGRGGKRGRFFAHGLVTTGLFAHVRNPLYLGNLAVVAGEFCAAGNLAALACGAAFFLLSYQLLVRGEERYLAERFPGVYAEYRARVPRWAPRLRGLARSLRAHRFDGRKVLAKEHGTAFLLVMVLLAIGAAKVWRGGGWAALKARLPYFLPAAAVAVAAYAWVRVLKKSGRLRPAAAEA